jgi:hypothetical protein
MTSLSTALRPAAADAIAPARPVFAIDRKEAAPMSSASRSTLSRGLDALLRAALVAGGVAALAAAAHVAGVTDALTADPAPRMVDCDCANVPGGVANMRGMRECREHQAKLYSALSHGTFMLREDGGVIVGGSICRADASGPAAWPTAGASMAPWAAPRG